MKGQYSMTVYKSLRLSIPADQTLMISPYKILTWNSLQFLETGKRCARCAAVTLLETIEADALCHLKSQFKRPN